MKKILLTSVAVAMATFASNAAVRPYVSAHLGYTHATILSSDERNDFSVGQWIDSKFALDVSGAFGVKYDISKSFALRGELEYDYLEKFENSETDDTIWMRSHTVLANAYLDFKTMSAFTPYISAGAGYQFNHLNTELFDKTTTPHAFAWQIGGGITYNINNALSVDLGYRYLTSTYSDKYQNRDTKFTTDYHQFRLGATYAF